MTKIDRISIRNQQTNEKKSDTKSRSSRENILSAAKNFNIEQSNIQLAIPTHRKRKYITMDEYQTLLRQGIKMSKIDEECLKGLIIFYNAMLKGKIQLPKEKFIEMYNKGITLDEIAKQHNVRKDQMCFLREFYGIKRKGAKYQKRLANEQPLSKETKDIIIGSILGDGHITKWGYFSEKHSPAQLEYLKWKASFLKQLTTNTSWDYYESIDKRSGSLIKSHSFRSTVHSFLHETRNNFYKEIDGKSVKIIPYNIANIINDRVLAVWFMDDGMTDWTYRGGIKQSLKSLPTCLICSESFTIEENIKLSEAIFKNFNISSKIKFHDNTKNKPRLWFSTVESEKLMKLIKPHIHSDLLYKVVEEKYLEKYLKTNQLAKNLSVKS
jgi:hypothetical protein